MRQTVPAGRAPGRTQPLGKVARVRRSQGPTRSPSPRPFPQRDARLREMEAAFALYLERLGRFMDAWKKQKEPS